MQFPDIINIFAPVPEKKQESSGFLNELSTIVLDSSKPGDEGVIAKISDIPVVAKIGDTVTEFVDTVVDFLLYGKTKRRTRGLIPKSQFDALSVTTVDIPASFAGLEAEMVPTRLQYQLFRVVEVVEDEDGVTITARHVWYDNLENYTLWKPDEKTQYTAAAVCRNILSNAISPVNSRVASDCTDAKVGKDLDYERKNLVEAFLDPKKGVCAKFGLSLIRDNWDFYCLKEVGFDRGIVIQNGKNLLGVERKESIENLATRIVPFAKNESGDIVWMNHDGLKYIDSQYANDYSYPRTELYDTGLQIGKDDVTERNIQDKLLAAAQKHFSEDKVDLPEVEMTIEFLSLGDTEEYAQYRDLDKVYLYDILTIKDTIRGYEYSAQVIGVEHDILTGMLNSVTIGSIKNSDGSRKIATWQVPEVSGENIRLRSILAGSFDSGAIRSADIGEGVIAFAHIAKATIDQLTADTLEAAHAQIHVLIAGSITADDIEAGSITTETLAAGAITTEKLDAGAITADKIAAGAITAAKIDATEIEAINAKLGTATIADARIALADIDYAHIKDLSATSAHFGEAVFEEAVGGKLYVPRLSVGYAQMLGATIGDLVIEASDGKYYGIDVDEDGLVTATERTVTPGEIDSGHTTDGRTLVLGTDILAADLNTENIYASHALMNEITASVINVDQLFAREATIGKINALDLSSNTYIQSVVGDWESGSTITQTINGINTRITSLGYGTFYYSQTEPHNEDLVAGDVWIKPISDNTWRDIANMTWGQVADMTWDEVMGVYEMYCWTGQRWKLLYDSQISADLQTQINQNAYAITLKADESVVDLLDDKVTDFEGILEVQSQEITAAVSAVNLKVANYVQDTDPSLDHTISLGDTWTRNVVGNTWGGVSEKTWRQIGEYTWGDIAGTKVYVWDGARWVLTSDSGVQKNNRAEVNITENRVAILASEQAVIGSKVYSNEAQLLVQADRITQEVARATNAEAGKISKTTQYQTADEIYSAAVNQASSLADGTYIAKTTAYQTADAIVTEAVKESKSAADGAYIKKTSTYQTAESIVSSAKSYTNGQLTNYSTTTQTDSKITAYVGEHAYEKISGIAITANGITVSGSQYVKINSGGYFRVTSGTFGIKSDADADDYAIWSGNNSAASCPFRVKKNGTVYLTKLMALDENNTESEVNLRTAGLWKLAYATVKSISVSGNTLTISTTSGTTTFRKATTAILAGSWGGKQYTVSAMNDPDVLSVSSGVVQLANTGASGSDITVRAYTTGEIVGDYTLSATNVYNNGWNAARNEMRALGTVYTIIDRQGDWVKVQMVGIGYSKPGAK